MVVFTSRGVALAVIFMAICILHLTRGQSSDCADLTPVCNATYCSSDYGRVWCPSTCKSCDIRNKCFNAIGDSYCEALKQLCPVDPYFPYICRLSCNNCGSALNNTNVTPPSTNGTSLNNTGTGNSIGCEDLTYDCKNMACETDHQKVWCAKTCNSCALRDKCYNADGDAQCASMKASAMCTSEPFTRVICKKACSATENCGVVPSNNGTTTGSVATTIGNNGASSGNIETTLGNNVPTTLGNNVPTTLGNNVPTTVGNNGQTTLGNNGASSNNDEATESNVDASAGNIETTLSNNVPTTLGNNGQTTLGNNGQTTLGNNVPTTVGNNGQTTLGDNGASSNNDEATESNVETTLGNNVPTTLGNNVPTTLGNNVPTTLGNNVPTTLGNNVPTTLGNNVPTTTGNNGQPTLSNNGASSNNDEATESNVEASSGNIETTLGNNVPTTLGNNVPTTSSNNGASLGQDETTPSNKVPSSSNNEAASSETEASTNNNEASSSNSETTPSYSATSPGNNGNQNLTGCEDLNDDCKNMACDTDHQKVWCAKTCNSCALRDKCYNADGDSECASMKSSGMCQSEPFTRVICKKACSLNENCGAGPTSNAPSTTSNAPSTTSNAPSTTSIGTSPSNNTDCQDLTYDCYKSQCATDYQKVFCARTCSTCLMRNICYNSEGDAICQSKVASGMCKSEPYTRVTCKKACQAC